MQECISQGLPQDQSDLVIGINHTMMEILIIRHPRERVSKCTLQPLREREGFRFLKGRRGLQVDVTGYLLLSTEAPVLRAADAGHPLLLLDSTWHLLPDLRACLVGTPIPRSLPETLRTAYPRRSKLHGDDPENGLASIEALYAALRLLGHRDDSLLGQYPWAEEFLAQFEE